MEEDHSSDDNTSPRRQEHENESPAKGKETVIEKWDRLMKHTAGPLLITELEGRLLTNDNESLNLDPLLPAYAPPEGTLMTVAMPTKGNRGGSTYINAHVDSMYHESVMEAALTKPGATETTASPAEIAKFCLQASHIERCYCIKVRNKELDEILPLELFRLINSTKRTPTVG
jgi:hypothetical protein